MNAIKTEEKYLGQRTDAELEALFAVIYHGWERGLNITQERFGNGDTKFAEAPMTEMELAARYIAAEIGLNIFEIANKAAFAPIIVYSQIQARLGPIFGTLGERISELLRFNNEFEERARVAERKYKDLSAVIARRRLFLGTPSLTGAAADWRQPMALDRIEGMEAHADEGGQLSHQNAVELLQEVLRLRKYTPKETATAQVAEAGPGLVATDQHADANTPAVIFWYRNHRGEEGYRRVIPIKFWHGATEWHKTPQMLLRAFDTEKNAERDFAVSDMSGFVGRSDIEATTPGAAAAWALCEALRADEGSGVELFCDNPDFNGQPNNAVECCGDWTGWDPTRFTGNTILEALRNAHQAMAAAKVP